MDDLRIERAMPGDADEVYALYHSLLEAPYSTWSEDYPTRDDVTEDVSHGWTLVMRTDAGRISAAIALVPGEQEPEFEEFAPWYPDVKRWACPARLGVALDQQGKGLARRMLSAAMDYARAEGYDGVRFLVAKSNPVAQRSYAKLQFDVCGECEMWGENWLCYQRKL